MTTAPVPVEAPQERRTRFEVLELRHAYTAFAIAAIWIAVALTTVFAPDIESTTVTDHTIVPSGVVVALFAFLATVPVAVFGFRERR
jgi:hypothetical protein